ncbi:hypothetical protein ABZ725_43010 [Streptomyces sp. NPDC006872]|uniref:hypothetical protein n=1 Tax=Streptomyces sp. NPDC006872 TaxID=3155720 RepID=UPI0033E8F589
MTFSPRTAPPQTLGPFGVFNHELRSEDPALQDQRRDAAAEPEELGFGTIWLGGNSSVRHAAKLAASTAESRRMTSGNRQLRLAARPVGAFVVICGAISQYDYADEVVGPMNYLMLLYQSASMAGIASPEFVDRYQEAMVEMSDWPAAGRLTSVEFPAIFRRLFTGENTGKLVLEPDAGPSLSHLFMRETGAHQIPILEP